MNTIIVPTDFSPAAEHATAYAAQLAQRLNASVLLLHVYQLPVPMADYPIMMVTASDLQKVADEGLRKAADSARKNFAGVQFDIESRLGDVITEIEEAGKERNAFVLVVGTKAANNFERFLFGDTTASLVKSSTIPVIAVPEGTTASLPSNIVFATDLQHTDEVPAAKIAGIASQLQASLHVVHVEVKSEETISPDPLMNALAVANASYHCINERDVEEGLKQYVQENHIDLVLVLPHKHNLYERLFFKGHTQGILHTMPVPVMSLRNE